MQTNTYSALALPISVLLGFAMVAAAIFFSGNGFTAAAQNGGLVAPTAHGGDYPSEPQAPAGPQIALKAELDDDEYIYGNQDAEVFIVEYSDIDCPFCARVHPTLEAVVDESEGQIAWVFRHFPLEQLHPDAFRKAMAAECVGTLAGNDAFWPFLDGLFKQELTDTYTAYGINATDFADCMAQEETRAAVQADLDRAVASGGRGTPYSIVATSEQGVPVSGAQPQPVWEQTARTIRN